MKSKKARFEKAGKSNINIADRKDIGGVYIKKSILYYIIVPIFSVIILSVFILAGIVIGKVSNASKVVETIPSQPEIIIVTKEPTTSPTLTPTPSPSQTPTPTPPPEVTEEKNYYGRLGGTNDGGANYMSRITFVDGEAANKLNLYYSSIEENKVWYAPSNHGAILEQLEVDVDGKKYLLPEAVGLTKPDILMFSFCGENSGSRSWTADEYVDAYENLINTIKKNASPSTKIVIISVFPITQEYEDNDDHYNQSNDRISEINRGLSKFAYNNECYYLDVNGVLRGDDGALKEEYSYKGYTINRDGYRVVYNYTKTHQVLH